MNNVTNLISEKEMDGLLSITGLELHYGMQYGRIVHVVEVSSGLECNCTCPHCGSKLIARKGDIRRHHFAHYDADDCNHATETAIHLMAKQIISDRKMVKMPTSYIHLADKDDNNHLHHIADYTPSEVTAFDCMMTEPPKDGYRPDLTALVKDGQWVDIEIKVTHKVDEIKAQKLAERQQDMIEIDLSRLSRLATAKELEEAVLFTAPRRLVYTKENEEKSLQLLDELNNKITYVNGLIHKSRSTQISDFSLNENGRDTVMLLGYKIGSGFSPKQQSEFNLAHLFCAEVVQTKDTTNFSVHSSGGFQIKQVDVKESLAEALETLSFPIEVKLQYESKPGFGRRTKWIVSDIVPVS